MSVDLDLGARVVADGVRFRVWAPRARELAVTIGGARTPMTRGAGDVWEGLVRGAGAGTDYLYVIDGERERPDPVSRSQPMGVHGPSRVVDPGAYRWQDEAWRGVALEDLVIYELHVGTFSPEGTFAGAIPKLPHLAGLGITAVELMPVAEFPGGRNWGYDGVHLFAPQSTYGGPDGLRALVDACHAHGLAVIVDVVYNHVGPEGNYLEAYAPFFTDAYRTPWGRAINYDGADSDGVRRHVVSNAAHWFAEYHADALRLDAIHGIFDHSAQHILAEIAGVRAAAVGRRGIVIGESDLNDVRVLRPPEAGGYGLDAQWSDDFHHALYTLLVPDPRGYLEDFGRVGQLAKAITDSFVYDGLYSHHRRRRHGNRAVEQPGQQFVIYVQNHDQVANASQGRRLTALVGTRAHGLAAAVLLTSPNLPMLFMGEEYGELAPFQYFVSHGEPALIEAVREGRRAELAGLGAEDVPDPAAEATFLASKLDWSLIARPEHARLLALYRELIALRRRLPCLGNCRKDLTRARWGEAGRWLVIERGDPSGQVALVACNVSAAPAQLPVEGPPGAYRLELGTDEPRFAGAGNAAPRATFELAAGQPLALALPAHAARVYLRETRVIEDGRARVVVLAVRPEVDGGRYPVKRVLGEPVEVEADLVVDGHDAVRAVLRHRHEAEAAWREVALEPAGNDAWRARFTPARLGRHRYTVIGWVDAFGTWRRGLERKAAAGVDVTLELREGALLVEAAAARVAADDAAVLRGALGVLRGEAPVDDKVARATSAAVAEAMARDPARAYAAQFPRELELVVDRPVARCSAWYELFPRSAARANRHGTLRDAMARLDYIAELGFDVVYLPPIHPIGRAFRKGPDNRPHADASDPGSPWAIGGPEGGHTAVHPELGTLADFDAFVAAARERRLEVALDIAFQASPDHPWVREHPTWFKRRPDGSIQYAENPPKKYQDVYPFDFESEDWKALWAALRDVFLFWAERGVRCFRVDNPHTKPIPFWQWCLAEVQARFPDAIFLAEAFTRPKLMYALAKVGFSQSYTYFTWRRTAHELAAYAREVACSPVAEFFRPSFWPTTPDIFPEYLAGAGRGAFVARLVLAATLSSAYGIYGPSFELMEHAPREGAEELARNEKYQVRHWDLDRPESLRHVIARLNRVRRAHPALHGNRSLRFHRSDNDLVLCYSKRTEDRGDVILVVVNLDPHHRHGAWLDLDLAELGVAPGQTFQVHDLLGDARYLWQGARNFVELEPDVMPAHVFELRRFVRSEHQFEYFL